jgi:hypothetical protein
MDRWIFLVVIILFTFRIALPLAEGIDDGLNTGLQGAIVTFCFGQ